MKLSKLTNKRPPKTQTEEVKVTVTKGNLVISDLLAERMGVVKGDRVIVHTNSDYTEGGEEDKFYIQKATEEDGGSKLGSTGEGLSLSSQFTWDKMGGNLEEHTVYVPNDVSMEDEEGLIGLQFDRNVEKQVRSKSETSTQSEPQDEPVNEAEEL